MSLADITIRPANYEKVRDKMEMDSDAGKAIKPVSDLIPGDVREFYNPKGTGAFHRENSIYLGGDNYFAWGFRDKAIMSRAEVIKRLTDDTGQNVVKALELPISIRPTLPKP